MGAFRYTFNTRLPDVPDILTTALAANFRQAVTTTDLTAAIAAIDHGALTGLGDDDHTQYHNDARGDARYLKLTGGTLSGSLTIQTAAGVGASLSVVGGTFATIQAQSTGANTATVAAYGELGYSDSGILLEASKSSLSRVRWWRGGTVVDISHSTPGILQLSAGSDLRRPAGEDGAHADSMIRKAQLDAHVNDTIDAHDASAISVADSGGNYAGSDVEAVLAEIASSLGGGGVSDHGALTGLADDDHTQYHTDTRGDARYYTKTLSDAAYQPKNSDLTSIAALAPSNNDVIQRKAGAWTNRTMAQLATDLDAAGLATDTALNDHINDTTDAHAASAISFTPSGTISATDVQAAIEEAVAEAGGGGADYGDVKATARATAPIGWMLCDGSAISRTTYANLFDAIGTTFGAGDGSTTFNIPDLRGRVIASPDDMGGTDAGRLSWANTPGTTGGEETHLLTALESGLRAHAHDASATTTVANSANNGSSAIFAFNTSGLGLATTGTTGAASGRYLNGAWTTGTMGSALSAANMLRHDHTATTAVVVDSVASAPASNAHNNMQPTILLNHVIYHGVP